jgi:signal transduction histidine kinase
MRGANVVRRRSVTNPGEAAGDTESVNGGQADGGGSGLLSAGGDPGSASWREQGSTGPQGATAKPGTAPNGQTGPAGAPSSQTALPSATPDGNRSAPPPRRPAPSQSRFALTNWRVRWRLIAVIAVPTLTAAILGSLQIYGDVSNWNAAGRVQHLAQLNSAVVSLTQKLEDERDLSAGYAANRGAGAALVGELSAAKTATTVAVNSVTSLAAGVNTASGYQASTVQNLSTLLNSLQDLSADRVEVLKSQTPAAKIVQVYTENIINPANIFSAAAGTGANDAVLQGNITTLGSLLRTENEMSVQRGILFAALSSPGATLRPGDLTNLEQAFQQQQADQADFNASTETAEQQIFSNTVSGSAVDLAASQEDLAESTANSTAPLTHNAGLTAGGWFKNQSTTIGDTRKVAAQLTGVINARADYLRSHATDILLVTSLVTLLLLLLVLLVSTIVARSLIRPLRKLRADALDVAGHRLPEMVRRLSQSEGADEGVEIEPIGVTSTDEIGEVARAFDQVHREAVRLAADEAMLRGNLNAMFINLSRRSQSLIERQLSLIDSLEQSEQDSGRLSSLFRLDHLATRMRRNSENLLVLAGHEVTRRWSQPVALVDVLRAAISEIEQYERVVLNVQPGIVVVGQAVNDVVHLVAEIVENATTFSPEDTQVYVSGQPLSSGGVLLDITDNGVGISDQEMSHANWRLDNPPVVDVAVSRRMGLFVVGRLAARHGVRVRLRHAQAGGLTALIWLPDTVAAPEVAPPLGRLRRFEAEDFGPAASLSAPTQALAPSAASQATAAARIPRFSPTPPAAPAAPAIPAVPSPAAPPFSPVAGAGSPAQKAQADSGPQADEGSTAPAVGLGDGGLAAARNGWDVGGGAWGGGRDESTTPALPVRNGNANGKPAGDNPSNATPFAASASPASAAPAAPASTGPANADIGQGKNQSQGNNQGQSQPTPNGPRLPAFTGLSSQGPQFPIGSQNVHGSDGPSASDPASPAGRPAAATNGKATEDSAANSGQVTVPPAGAQEPWLPIFDSLESDWFRRSGQTMTATQQRPQGTPATQATAAGQAAPQAFRISPADEGFKAAQAVASPEAGETTGAGLPRRVPRANLVPGSVGSGGGQEPEAEAPVRSPDAIRNRMASFQRGVREGRAVAPQIEEPQDR